MFGHSGQPASAASLSGWSLVFAREPEPDPDLDDIPDSPTERIRPGAPPVRPQKPPRRTPVLLILLLVLVAGLVYLSLNMEMLSGMLPESVMDLLGEAPPPSAPPAPPAPGEAPSPTGPLASRPGPTPDEALSPSAPTPPSMPGQPPAQAAPDAAPSGQPSAPGLELPAPAAADKPAIPTPRFGEGQRAFVSPDPDAPSKPLTLSGDAAGTRPGPMLRPGAIVTVLDGELLNNAWVYSVRTQEGEKGWIPERRLQARP